MYWVPGVLHRLGQKVDPAAIGRRKGQSVMQGRRGNADRNFIQVNDYVAVFVPLLQKQGIGGADDVGCCAIIG